jgi:hypothetical protein
MTMTNTTTAPWTAWSRPDRSHPWQQIGQAQDEAGAWRLLLHMP